MDNDNTPLKRCTKCGQEYPATPEYFKRLKSGKNGLHPECKPCSAARDRIVYQQNREKYAELGRQWRERNHQHSIEQQKAYRQANKDKIRQRRISYKQQAGPQITERNQNYRLLNREKLAEKQRAYHKRNPHIQRAAFHRREARKRSLPDTFTSKDWLRCLDYWHACCAVCGGQLRDLFGHVAPHADHWIPLSYNGADNPGTVPTNMLCLCNSCNNRKFNRMPEKWLISIFGKAKAAEILERINTYFEFVKANPLP